MNQIFIRLSIALATNKLLLCKYNQPNTSQVRVCKYTQCIIIIHVPVSVLHRTICENQARALAE